MIANESVRPDFLHELGFQIERYSSDKRKNNFGSQLINFCKYNDLFICNGRIGDDQKLGEFACKNVSVID